MQTGADPVGSAAVPALAQPLLGGQPLIVASNRGPVEFWRGPDGRLQARRGSGGLVTALSALRYLERVHWVAAPQTPTDHLLAAQSTASPIPGWPDGHRLALAPCPPELYATHYITICNRLLWFHHHYLLEWGPGLATQPLRWAWEHGYCPVNRLFAETIVRLAAGQPRPVVLLQDYHLYLVGAEVRRRCPGARLLHFVHVPWPEPRAWQWLPAPVRTAILTGLLACDIVGLQTPADAQNFLHTCLQTLPAVRMDDQDQALIYQGHRTRVRVYPVSVDPSTLVAQAHSPSSQRSLTALRALQAERTIVRVDRLDPVKNLHRGFLAYQALLERRPDLHGRVVFLACLVPSRTAVPEYRRYGRTVRTLVSQINRRWGTAAWQPIRLFVQHNYEWALAALRLYDVLLVNPLVDGMNLVAKEGPVVNERDGVLVLSETAGACQQLRAGALTVAAVDVEGTTAALEQALGLSPTERRDRAARLRAAILATDALHWLAAQLADLAALRSGEPGPPAAGAG